MILAVAQKTKFFPIPVGGVCSVLLYDVILRQLTRTPTGAARKDRRKILI